LARSVPTVMLPPAPSKMALEGKTRAVSLAYEHVPCHGGWVWKACVAWYVCGKGGGGVWVWWAAGVGKGSVGGARQAVVCVCIVLCVGEREERSPQRERKCFMPTNHDSPTCGVNVHAPLS